MQLKQLKQLQENKDKTGSVETLCVHSPETSKASIIRDCKVLEAGAWCFLKNVDELPFSPIQQELTDRREQTFGDDTSERTLIRDPVL